MSTSVAAALSTVRPGAPQGAARLRLVPLLGPSRAQPDYRLLDRAILDAVQVEEVSEAGHVPELRVENRLGVLVFLMDGQGLVGAKQNRILNTDVLVPPNSRITIPVSCVEAGRWAYRSRSFASGTAASHRVRARKSSRVYESLKAKAAFDADQCAVWNDVSESLAVSKTRSRTTALHDAYASRAADLAAYRAALRAPPGAVGLAAFFDGRFLGLDLFDRASTFAFFFESLVDSYGVDWLFAEAGDAPRRGDGEEAAARPGDDGEAAALARVIAAASAGKWEAFASPGEGRDLRLDDPALAGSALVCGEDGPCAAVVHLQLFPR